MVVNEEFTLELEVDEISVEQENGKVNMNGVTSTGCCQNIF